MCNAKVFVMQVRSLLTIRLVGTVQRCWVFDVPGFFFYGGKAHSKLAKELWPMLGLTNYANAGP